MTNKITVEFLNRNENRRHKGRRFPRVLRVTMDVNPRKDRNAAVMAAAKLAQIKFGKVKLLGITS